MQKTSKDLTAKERKAYQKIGRRGGLATAEKGFEYMSSLGKLGATKRWGGKSK